MAHRRTAVVVSGCALVVLACFGAHVLVEHGARIVHGGALVFDGFGVFVTGCVGVMLLGSGWLPRARARWPRGVVPHGVPMLTTALSAVVLASTNSTVVALLGVALLALGVGLESSGTSLPGLPSLGRIVALAGATATFALGIGLLYGATGTLNLVGMARFFSTTVVLDAGVLDAGLLFTLAGLVICALVALSALASRDTASWPSATPIALVGVEAVSVRIFVSSGGLVVVDWRAGVLVAAVLVVGVGLVLLARSRGSRGRDAGLWALQFGLALAALVAANDAGVRALLFLVVVTWAVVLGLGALQGITGPRGFSGLVGRMPAAGVAGLLLVAGAAGVPGTLGFVARRALFAAWKGPAAPPGVVSLGVVGVVLAALVLLIHAVDMIRFDGEGRGQWTWAERGALTAALLLVVGCGVVPGPLEYVVDHATLLFG